MAKSEIPQGQPATPQQAVADDQAVKPGEQSLTNFTAPSEAEWTKEYWRRRNAQTEKFPLGDH